MESFSLNGKKNRNLLPVLFDICEYLNRDFGDIMEAVPENKE